MLGLGLVVSAVGFMIGGYTGMALPFWTGVGITSIAILRKLIKRRRTQMYAYQAGDSF